MKGDYYILDNDYEERVFWIFVHIMQEKNWRGLFLNQMEKLMKMINNFENKLEKSENKIYQHIKSCDV